MSVASLGVEWLRSEEAFRILREILQNRRAKVNFSPTLRDELSHFERYKSGKCFFPFNHEFGCIVHHRRAFGDGRCRPRAERARRGIKRGQHLFIRMFGKGFEHLSVSWIDTAIWHVGTPSRWMSHG